jgi:hypothetical protein
MSSKERHEARYQRRKAKRAARKAAKIGKYDNYDRAISTSALIGANWASRKGVMWKGSVARYNARYFKNARKSHRKLAAEKDIRQGFYHFPIIERGKLRDVHSLHYPERVIRRSICTNAMVPILSNGLIYDNGASLEGKGISFAVNRCAAMLHRYWRKYRDNDGYVLVVDFKKYFDNIKHEPMFNVFDHEILDKRLNRLCCSFVEATGETGLYIGPEDSQISAIAYPSRIDHKIKDTWHCKYYARYMDDSYIIMRSKSDLFRIRDLLFAEYEKQGIVLNKKKTQVVKLSRGFTFLKTQYLLKPNGRVVQKPCRASTIRQRRKLKAFRRFVSQSIMTVEQVCNSYMSWRGFMTHKDAHRTIRNMDKLVYNLFAVKPWIKHRKHKHKWKGALKNESVCKLGSNGIGNRNPRLSGCPF